MGDIKSFSILLDHFFTFENQSPDFFNNLTGIDFEIISTLNENIRYLSKWDTLSVTEKEAQFDSFQTALNAVFKALANEKLTGLYGYTALISASSSRVPDIVDALLDAGAKLNLAKENGYVQKQPITFPERQREELYKKNDNGTTPLIEAILKNDFETVQRLIARGADVNLSRKDGMTPLMFAEGNPRIIKLLLDNNANINASMKNGFTALMLAVKHRSDETMKLLLENNADVNAQSVHGPYITTALSLARDGAHREDNRQAIELLKSKQIEQTRLIQDFDKLLAVMTASLPLDQASLLSAVGNNIERIISNSEQLSAMLKILPKTAHELLIENIGPTALVNIINQGGQEKNKVLLENKLISRTFKYHSGYTQSYNRHYSSDAIPDSISAIFREIIGPNKFLRGHFFTHGDAFAQNIIDKCSEQPTPTHQELLVFLKQKLNEIDGQEQSGSTYLRSTPTHDGETAMRIMYCIDQLKKVLMPNNQVKTNNRY